MAKTAKGSGTDNRQKIIDTAIAMIGEKGVDKTSLAQISTASGLSKGTLYYYYASKNDLIFDIADRHIKQISAVLFSMIDDKTPVSWEQLLTAFFETLLDSRDRSRLHLYLVREAIAGNDSLKTRFQTTYTEWFSMVNRAHSRMPGPQTDVSAKSKFFVALVDGFILQVLLDTEKTAVRDIVRLALKVVDACPETDLKF